MILYDTYTGILCPHRGAVYSFTWRHKAFPYVEDDREACNVFFIWEMIRPLLKGNYVIFSNLVLKLVIKLNSYVQFICNLRSNYKAIFQIK
jgi:hypothetical protein